MNKAEFAVEILEKYAKYMGFRVRTTLDMSPFEIWLIFEMYKTKYEDK